MNETQLRSRAANSDQTSTRKPARAERIRIAVAGAASAALLSLALVGATAALGGSGGTGPGVQSHGSKDRYDRMWSSFSKRDKRWARRTSRCESGGNAKIHSRTRPKYHGAFQFLKSTWRRSPKSPGGDPHRYSWRTQAVVAVKLKHRDGAGHWPVCGR